MAVMAVTSQAATGILAKADKAEMDHWVDSVMNTMTLRERIAQLMVVTFLPDDSPELRKRLDRFVGEYHIGGLLTRKVRAKIRQKPPIMPKA